MIPFIKEKAEKHSELELYGRAKSSGLRWLV